MGGYEKVGWPDALDAAFDAALAREEEVAAADLAFSLRQDVDVRDAVRRSGSAWALVGAGEARLRVDEVGIDYVRAGSTLTRTRAATLRSEAGPSPDTADATFLQRLGAAARAGATVAIAGLSGRLVRVGKDHVALLKDGRETIVGLDAVVAVRVDDPNGYSASRGFSG